MFHVGKPAALLRLALLARLRRGLSCRRLWRRSGTHRRGAPSSRYIGDETVTFTERTGHLRVAFPEDSSAEAEQFSQPEEVVVEAAAQFSQQEAAVAQVVVVVVQYAQPEVAVVLVAQE